MPPKRKDEIAIDVYERNDRADQHGWVYELIRSRIAMWLISESKENKDTITAVMNSDAFKMAEVKDECAIFVAARSDWTLLEKLKIPFASSSTSSTSLIVDKWKCRAVEGLLSGIVLQWPGKDKQVRGFQIEVLITADDQNYVILDALLESLETYCRRPNMHIDNITVRLDFNARSLPPNPERFFSERGFKDGGNDWAAKKLE